MLEEEPTTPIASTSQFTPTPLKKPKRSQTQTQAQLQSQISKERLRESLTMAIQNLETKRNETKDPLNVFSEFIVSCN